MRSVILYALIMQGLAEEKAVGDKLADMMVNRLLGASLQGENLDDSTLAKTGGAVQSVGLPMAALAPQMRPLPPAIAKLPGSPALKSMAISAMEASNRRSCFAVKASNYQGIWNKPAPIIDTGGRTLPGVGEGEPLTLDQVKRMAGVSAPFDKVFDPLGLATKSPEGNLLWFRHAELKHGRVCMLASLGMFVSEKWHPLFGGDIDVPSALLGGPAIEETGFNKFWLAILLHVGVFDVLADTYRTSNNFAPGDYGFDPFKYKPQDEASFRALQNKELNNGRLAMFATMGILAQELLTGQKIF